tara:strand:+ start:219 stop:1091 length:873 start_codon:yes stop_codon:yes gene_type:complete
MKILLNIVHFQNKKSHFLNELIKEYNSFDLSVDIFIHTNKKSIKNLHLDFYNNGNITIKRHYLFLKFLFYRNKNYYLTWTPRKLIKKNIEKYDIFIYSEDDILIPKKAFEYWLDTKDKLYSLGYLPGFILIEHNRNNEEIAVGFKDKKLRKIIKVNDKHYLVNDNNRYMASWIYDKNMIKDWIDTGFFDIRKVTTKKAMRSNFLDKLKINNLTVRYLLYNLKNKKGFGIRENSAFGMNSLSLNIINDLLFKLENSLLSDDNKIYHLPNSYSDTNHPDGIGTIKLNDVVEI